MKNAVYQKKFDKVEVGSMNARLFIYSRSIQPPKNDDLNFTQKFVPKWECWGAIETVNGVTMFDQSNIERVVTHKFYIRNVPCKLNNQIFRITAEDWIFYFTQFMQKKNIYNIVKVENLGEEGRYLKILATLTGDDGVQANYA